MPRADTRVSSCSSISSLTDYFSVVRASLGAMSTQSDVDTFVSFVQKTFINQGMWNTLNSTLKDEEIIQNRTEERRFSKDTLVSV